MINSTQKAILDFLNNGDRGMADKMGIKIDTEGLYVSIRGKEYCKLVKYKSVFGLGDKYALKYKNGHFLV